MKTACARVTWNLCFVAVFSAANAGLAVADEAAPAGRIDFEAAKLPAANLEVDLSQDTFHSLFGISDAAIAGVSETLLKSSDKEECKDKHLVAEQVEAVRKIVLLGGSFVREVRVRAYESLPEGTEAESVLKPFEGQLKAARWETIVRMKSDDDTIRVAILHKDGSIRGLFVTATDGEQLAVANIVCDLSPDKVKPFTAAVAEIGKSIDLQPIIQWKMSQIADTDQSPPAAPVNNLTIAVKAAPAAPAAEKAKK